MLYGGWVCLFVICADMCHAEKICATAAGATVDAVVMTTEWGISDT
jgi:hypothetical protein